MVIIGSACLKHYFEDFPRLPKDIDYLVPNKNMLVNVPGKVEYHENEVLWSNFIAHNTFPKYLPINLLYTLKISHLFWDINWSKHMFDVQFMQNKGCVLDKELFYKLYKYWNTVHEPNKRSNLSMNAKDFFDNAIRCKYSHDYLHTLLINPPTYTKVLEDNQEVQVSEDKFNSLSFEDKCSLVIEEVQVMAYERYQNISDYRFMYSKMLKKFIINHAPLWEALFIIQNYVLLHTAKFDFVKLISQKLQQCKRNIICCS